MSLRVRLALVTTAKDMARLTGDPDPSLTALAARAEVAAVRLIFDDEDAVARFLTRRLGPSSAGSMQQTAALAGELPLAQEFGS